MIFSRIIVIHHPFYLNINYDVYDRYSFLFLMQDQGLEVIAEGLDSLKNMAHDMNEVGLHDILSITRCINHIKQ